MSSKLKAVDIFDKFVDDALSEQTWVGRVSSVLVFWIGVFFVLSRVVVAIYPPVHRELLVDTGSLDMQEPMNISLSAFVDMPCYFLHLDFMDSLGFKQLDVLSTVRMRRFSANRQYIGDVDKTSKAQCYPCYGLMPEGECCNSCEQLMLLSLLQGRKPDPTNWIQCKEAPNVSMDEKCEFKGKLAVNRVDGSFHIGLGRNVNSSSGAHQHDLSLKFPHPGLSHKIERLRFGNKIRTASEPLSQIGIVQDERVAIVYTYDLVLTPVVYIRGGKIKDSGFEYKQIPLRKMYQRGMRTPPGIYFTYKFSPYTVAVKAEPLHLISQFTTCISVISGIYAMGAIMERFMSTNRVLVGNK